MAAAGHHDSMVVRSSEASRIVVVGSTSVVSRYSHFRNNSIHIRVCLVVSGVHGVYGLLRPGRQKKIIIFPVLNAHSLTADIGIGPNRTLKPPGREDIPDCDSPIVPFANTMEDWRIYLFKWMTTYVEKILTDVTSLGCSSEVRRAMGGRRED